MDGMHEMHLPHPDDPGKQQEHLALFELVPHHEATHYTTGSGAWTNASNWHTGTVPGANAKVWIKPEHSITYNRNSGLALDWVRVDGTLSFQPNIDTRLVTEHLIVDPMGVLEIGTAASPIQAARTALIEIDTTRGPIIQAEGADPFALGRGLISHGQTVIHGAPKKAYTTLAQDARAGDSQIVLNESNIPQGWRVGDVLVIAGTEADLHETHGQNWFGVGSESQEADRRNERFKDEVVEITAMSEVNGKVRVSFINRTNTTAQGSTSLLWNHGRLDGDLFNPSELAVHVANLTRNVVLQSSDPNVPIQERGHLMIMHNRNAQICYFLAKDLGRTDKSRPADDPAALGNFVGDPSTGTNPRGRYGIHFHRVGGQLDVDEPALLKGSVVWSSPGWGIVHHDSYAVLEDNVVFDVVGAGIIAEDGNEIGEWFNNLVIKATGEPVSNFDDNHIIDTGRQDLFDLGFVGSGYWIQGGGAGLIIENNVAVSCNAAGFDLVPTTGLVAIPHPEVPVSILRNQQLKQMMEDLGNTEIDINAATPAPIRGLTVYNSFRGIHTWLHKRNSQDKEYTTLFAPKHTHQLHLIIEDFKLWHVLGGIQNFYSADVIMRDGLVVGDPEQYVEQPDAFTAQDNNAEGIAFSSNMGDATAHFIERVRVEGFEYFTRVVDAWGKGDFGSTTAPSYYGPKHSPYAVGAVRDVQIANGRYAFHGRIGTNLFYPYFEVDGLSVTSMEPGNQLPQAAFTAYPVGGLNYVLDASESFDVDPHRFAPSDENNIAAYAWDINSDGIFDAWGRDVVINFASPGARPITLTVYDSHGATAELTQSINAQPHPYPNPLVDPDFNDAAGSRINQQRYASGYLAVGSRHREEGWFGDHLVQRGGYLEAIDVPRLQQIIGDEYILRGEQTLNLRVRQTSPQAQTADLWVTVYGVDGQFYTDQENVTGTGIYPVEYSTLPVEATVLIHENIGGPQYTNWRDVALTGDFGAGYEYIVVQLAGSGHNIAGGDTFAITSASLTGAAPVGGEAVIDFEAYTGNNTAPLMEPTDSAGTLWSFTGLSNNVKTYDRNGSIWIGTVYNGDEGLTFSRADGQPFNLLSLDLYGIRGNRTYTLTGHLSGGGTITTTVTFTHGWSQVISLEFESWSDLIAVEIDNSETNDGRVFLDNIVTFSGEGGGPGPIEDKALFQDARWGIFYDSWSQARDASAAVDGDLATGVGTYTGTDKTMQWIGVDLGQPYEISQVNHIWDSDARHRAVDYTIEVSINGETWTPVLNVTDNPDVEVSDTINPTVAQFVRIAVTQGGFSQDFLVTRVILDDLQVMAR